jgi:menaquinone-dependent protoporphyrinogen oxidase
MITVRGRAGAAGERIAAGPETPSIPEVPRMRRVLVAYASRYGSTAEVAREIASVLTGAGLSVDVMPVEQARDLSPYEAIVLGTAVRMEKPLKATLTFATEHRRELGRPGSLLFAPT